MPVAETFSMALDAPMLSELAARGVELPGAEVLAGKHEKEGGAPPAAASPGAGPEEARSLSAFARLDT